MFDRLLFPTDGGEGAEAVLDHVLDLARAHDATVYVLYVADTTRDSATRVGGEVIDVLEREGEDVVEAAADRARDAVVDAETEVLQGQPYETIVGYADTVDADLIAMPTRGRTGLERLLLGSTTERVVRQSEGPVLTIRPDADFRHPFENVLVPTDGSDPARAALARAVDLATVEGANLKLLSVVDVAGLGVDVRAAVGTEALIGTAEEVLEEAREFAAGAGELEPTSATVETGASVHGTVLEQVEDRDVDLIVVGTHGRTGFDRYLLGSVAEKLIRTSPVPVMTVRGSSGSESV
ncbi:MAG: universal stress protein [Halobacteriales archaeon]